MLEDEANEDRDPIWKPSDGEGSDSDLEDEPQQQIPVKTYSIFQALQVSLFKHFFHC